MKCAIHQPNFFPWLGYFDKIVRSDCFVFLDKVDYEKSGHSMQCYTNRVSILGTAQEKQYIYCPVEREHGPQMINTVRIKSDINWRANIRKTMDSIYFDAPFKEEIDNILNVIFEYNTDYLAEFNIFAITTICNELGINTVFKRQSDMDTENHSTRLLVEIAQNVGCKEYIYGKGGSNYQEENIFKEANIDAIPQNYHSIVYKQGVKAGFVEGLSIIDALYWLGKDEVAVRLKG